MLADRRLRFAWESFSQSCDICRVPVFAINAHSSRRIATVRAPGVVVWSTVATRVTDVPHDVERDAVEAVTSNVHGCLRLYASIPAGFYRWSTHITYGLPPCTLRWRVEEGA